MVGFKYQNMRCNLDSLLLVTVSKLEKRLSNATNLLLIVAIQQEVKCKPPRCRMLCPFGWQKDENGCDICRCLQPCQVKPFRHHLELLLGFIAIIVIVFIVIIIMLVY